MSNEGLRIRVAELVGWFDIAVRKPGIDDRLVGYMKDANGEYLFGGGCSEIPDYPNDLNAMRVVIVQMIGKDITYYEQYHKALFLLSLRPLIATAEQQAEAFIQVMEGT